MNEHKLIALCTELCDNVRDGLLSHATAADAIAAAASSYVPSSGSAVHKHDGYAPHSHEVRPDHLGVGWEKHD